MTKLMLIVLGVLVLAGTALMVRAAPEREGTVSAQSTMDIRAIEQKVDLNALPSRDLDPTVYQ